MELPDASLELVFSAGARVPRFKTGAVLLAAGAVSFAPAARAAAGTAFIADAALPGGAFTAEVTAALASACALLFTVVLAGLATVFGVVALDFLVGASALLAVFVGLLAAVFNNDLPTAVPGDFALGVPAAFFAAAFLGADLVTVAFIFILFLS